MRRKPWTIAALAATVAACGGGGGTAAPPDGGSVDAAMADAGADRTADAEMLEPDVSLDPRVQGFERFRDQLAAAVCDKLLSCCGPRLTAREVGSLPVTDAVSCARELGKRRPMNSTLPMLESDAIRFDERAAAACLEAVRAGGCRLFGALAAPPPCALVLRGALPTGSSCNAHTQCQSHSCSGPGGPNNRCGPDLPCTYDPAACGPGAHCDPTTDRCAPLGSDGASCTSHRSCAPGLWCIDSPDRPIPGTCGRGLGAGEPCSGQVGSRRPCAEGLVCLTRFIPVQPPDGGMRGSDAGAATMDARVDAPDPRARDGGGLLAQRMLACAPPGGMGEICSSGPDTCQAGLICVATDPSVSPEGRCRAPAAAGEACAGDFFCMRGLVCHPDGRCAEPAGIGASCQRLQHCQPQLRCSTTCQPKVPIGGRCMLHGDCPPGAWCAIGGTCQSGKDEGQSCLSLFDCHPDLTCDLGRGVCATKRADRELCISSVDCQSGFCAGGLCHPAGQAYEPVFPPQPYDLLGLPWPTACGGDDDDD